MGADIHMKTYVWSKVENKYIDAYSLCDNLSILMREYHSGEFPELVGDRFYDLFDLFGGGRSCTYEELKCLKGGVPDFVNESTFGKLLDSNGNGYYGFSWCYYPEFKKELTEYVGYLSDPERFLDHDSDLYHDWKENPESDEVKNLMDETTEQNNFLKNEVEKIIGKLKFYDDLLNPNIPCHSFEDDLAKLIDVEKTIFVFWFDN